MSGSVMDPNAPNAKVVSIVPDAASLNAGLFGKLEGVLTAARQLEVALDAERARTRKLEREVKEAHHVYDRLLRDEKSRSGELSARESRLREQLAKTQESELQLRSQASALYDRLRSVTNELTRYKTAWAGVLQREREAKMILGDSEGITRRLSDLDSQNKSLDQALKAERATREQAERHAKSYQLELQNALVRLHAAEAKFAELSKEFQVLSQSRRTLEEEIAKAETAIRERLQWEFLQEREKVRADLERTAALERERYRDEIAERLRQEWDRKAQFERAEIQRQKQRFEAETQRLERELSDMRRELLRSKNEAADKENEAAEARSAMDQVQAQIELLKEELDRAAARERELDRARAELSQARAELERERQRSAELRGSLEGAERELKARKPFPAAPADIEIKRLEERLKTAEAKLAQETQLAEQLRIDSGRAIEEAVLAERKKAVEIIQRLRRRRGSRLSPPVAAEAARAPGQPPPPPVALVNREIAAARRDAESFRLAFESEAERAQGLEAALASERERFEEMACLLNAEVDRLRTVYPLRDLLASKEQEARRAQQELERHPIDSPERRRAQESVEIMVEQRDRLREMVRESERRIDEQLKRIQRASELDGWLSGRRQPSLPQASLEEPIRPVAVAAADFSPDLPEC